MSCGYFLLVSVSTLHVVDVLWNMHILPWIARWMHQRREVEEVVKLILETKLLNHLDRSLTGRKFEANLKLCTWHIEQQKIINQMEEMLRGWHIRQKISEQSRVPFQCTRSFDSSSSYFLLYQTWILSWKRLQSGKAAGTSMLNFPQSHRLLVDLVHPPLVLLVGHYTVPQV